MLKSQTPETYIFYLANIFRLKEVRDRFYDLIVNCIPPDLIIKELLEFLLKATPRHNLKETPKAYYELIAHAADVDNKMKLGSKAIFHLEAFAARCMVVLKKK
jgi:replication factor C subunit 3/5